MAPLELLEEFYSAIDYSGETTNSNASFGQSREHGQAPRSTMHGQAGAVADMSPCSLTKAELADLLFEKVGLNKREAKDLVDAFFDEISDALVRGEAVKLSGFGNFQVRDKTSRPGRNPKTGVQVNIPSRRVVTFHASQKLKSIVDALPLARQPDENLRC